MNYFKKSSLVVALVLLGACTLDLKNIGTPESGDGSSGEATSDEPTTGGTGTGVSTGELEEPCTQGPACAACVDPQVGVGPVELSVTLVPEPVVDLTLVLEATCVVQERLSSDVQDGLVLACQSESGAVEMRISYSNGQLLLPDSVIAGLEVTARYMAIGNELRDHTIVVRETADNHVILAAHQGPELVVLEEDVGPIQDFWLPIQLETVETACAAFSAGCDLFVRRGALRFTVDGDSAVLLDHQVGKLGPFGVHVGGAIDIVDGIGCDGGPAARAHDFVIVHSPG